MSLVPRRKDEAGRLGLRTRLFGDRWMRLGHRGDSDRTTTACLLESLLRSDGRQNLVVLLDLASVSHFLKGQAPNHGSLSLKGPVTFALVSQSRKSWGSKGQHSFPPQNQTLIYGSVQAALLLSSK